MSVHMPVIHMYQSKANISVADPRFPVGGAPTHWGGANLRHVHFSVKTYAKTKEIDPVGGGGGRAPAAPPGSASVYVSGNM